MNEEKYQITSINKIPNIVRKYGIKNFIFISFLNYKYIKIS